jgi:hypothetical protein
MHDKTALRWRPDGKPALVLMQYGLEGDFTAASENYRKADCTLRLWLYPLPPPEPGTLSIDSPSPGPGPASCPLDGRAIVTAATKTQPYWHWPRRPRPPASNSASFQVSVTQCLADT